MAEFYLVICLYTFQSQTYRINELTSDISWVCSYTNMWFKFVDVRDGRVIYCSIKKSFLPYIYTKVFYLKHDLIYYSLISIVMISRVITTHNTNKKSINFKTEC